MFISKIAYATAIKRKLLPLSVALLCMVALPFSAINASAYKRQMQTEMVCLVSRKPAVGNAVYKMYTSPTTNSITVNGYRHYKTALFYYNKHIISRLNNHRKKFLPKTNAFVQAPLKLPPASAEEAIPYL